VTFHDEPLLTNVRRQGLTSDSGSGVHSVVKYTYNVYSLMLLFSFTIRIHIRSFPLFSQLIKFRQIFQTSSIQGKE
jgi:hypothetical protein